MNPVQSISLQVLQSGDSYYAVLEAQTPVGAPEPVRLRRGSRPPLGSLRGSYSFFSPLTVYNRQGIVDRQSS